MTHRVGQQFGNYRLVRSLGRGAFAEVYLGEHLYLKTHAALKVLHSHLEDKDSHLFLAEAQTLARLTHPHIVRVLEFGVEQEGTAFLVIEYVPRGTLRKRYPAGSCLALATAASYVTQIASALHYAHTHKIIHRDVKPDNILLGPGQQVLLSDFGLSLFSLTDKLLEVPGWTGTFPYMAPELFQGRPEFASDQYALAIMAYEWLCGKRPFQGDALTYGYQHLHVPPPPLREHDPSLPQAVEGVVLKALAKDPQQRYASVQHFAQAFGQACQAPHPSGYLGDAAGPLPSEQAAATSRRIFLSAARSDEAFATRLASEVRMRGMAVWNQAPAEAPQTVQLEEELRRALRAADVVLLLMSAATASSAGVQQHLRLASQYQRPLVCVQTTEAAPASLLPEDWPATIQVDQVDARERPYERVLDDLLTRLEHDGAEEEPALLDLVGEPRSPYKGLRAFTQADAPDFFGREPLIEELIQQARRIARPGQPGIAPARLLAVIGPSGSGKSSVVLAGLLPQLQQGALPGSQHWVYLSPMVPGAHPLEALAFTLAPHLPTGLREHLREELVHEGASGLHRLASQAGQKVVLVIDQFEEVFTMTTSEQEREHFINLLITAATEPHGAVIVLLTLRADFYHLCMDYPRLHRLIEKQQKSVLPIEAADLRTVIKGPAALPDVQVAFEGNLVSELLFAVQEQAGALPLLQFTLEQLFLRRQGRLLTLQAYRDIGGVRGALVRHAEAVYAALPSEEQRDLARRLFLRLVDPGLTEQDTTRRRAAVTELLLPDPRQSALLYQTAEAFIAARLLTTNEIAGTTTVEISHEALIREWRRLGDWLRAAREDIRLQQMISADVAEWQQRGRPDDLLYRGMVLAEAEVWAKRQAASAGEVAFLRSSAAKQQEVAEAERVRQARELLLQRRATNRLRGLASVLSIFLVVAVILSSVAFVNGQEAQKQAGIAQRQAQLVLQQLRVADSRALARQGQLASLRNKPDEALLLATKAYQTNNNFDTRDTLFSLLLARPHLETVVQQELESPGSGGGFPPLSGLVFGASDQTLIRSVGGEISIWDLTNKHRHFLTPSPFLTEETIDALAISPDSQILAAEESINADSDSAAPEFFIALWDLTTGKSRTRLNISQPTTTLVFSPDGRMLALGECRERFCTHDGQVAFLNIASGQFVGSPLFVPGTIASMAFNPAGTRLALAICAQSDQPQSDQHNNLYRACKQSQIIQEDVASQKLLNPPVTGHTGPVLNMVFSPDGKFIASAGPDGIIFLWDAATGNLADPPLIGHTGSVTSLAFSPDSTILASGSQDETVRLWEVSNGASLGILTGHASPVSQVAFSHDGRHLASGDYYYGMLLWRIRADTPVSRQFLRSNNTPVALSPDGKILAYVDDGNRITLWNIATGKAVTTLTAPEYTHTSPPPSVFLSFSADGKTLASMAQDTIILWDIATGKRIGQPLQDRTLSRNRGIFDHLVFSSKDPRILASSQSVLAFSPNGRVLAFSGVATLWDITTGFGQQLPVPPEGTVILWNVKEGKKIDQFPTSGIAGMAFSPDGHILATSTDYTITLWNISTGKPQQLKAPPFHEQQAYLESNTAFSPDGTLLASALSDTLRLWVWDGTTYVPFVQDVPQFYGSPTFSSDGHWLFVTGYLGTMLLNVSLQSWQTIACTIANRNFSQLEWDQFAAGEPYRQICSQFPVHPSVVLNILSDIRDVKDRTAASAALKKAVQISLQSDDPLLSDDVCWSGATEGFAKEALPACDHTVQLDANNGGYHDSRGLARALTGDTTGAIQDFEFFLNWARGNDLSTEKTSVGCPGNPPTFCKAYKQEREDWIAALKAGKSDPFKDAKALLALAPEKSYTFSI
jgi:WD40 repeat protein/tRNA A-37 threonylcarbamoyl transferase component Bud32